MKQRILQIIDSLDHSGAAQQLCFLAHGLPAGEFDVRVCCLSRGGALGDTLARGGVPVRAIGRRWPADAMTFWQLQRYAREFRPQVLIGWQSVGRAYAAAVARRSGAARLLAVWREVEPQRWPLERTIDRFVGRRAGTVVVTCPAVREHCIGQGIAAEKIEVISGGVCPAAASQVTRGQILERLGLPESARLIGWAGRLTEDRGGKDAIWAADLLKVIRDDAHLLICGDGPHRERLFRFRQQVEIADKVHFLGDRGDWMEFLPHLDQFWSTRRLPGQSQAILEALGAGVPVVATDLPGTSELIVHETGGYLVAAGHRAGFARWAEYLLNHPDAARRIGTAGRQRVEREFSSEKMLRKWRDLLERVRDQNGQRVIA